MGFNTRLAPYSVISHHDADPAADVEFVLFRFPVAGRVVSAYATNDAAIATATNTLALYLTKYSGTTLQGTVGSWAAGSTWAADTPRAMTLTSFGSTAQFTAGDTARMKYDETATGTWTRLTAQMDYIPGYDV